MTIPSEVMKERHTICRECQRRKEIAHLVDMHFDWLDCPYDCENDYEHWERDMRGEVK